MLLSSFGKRFATCSQGRQRGNIKYCSVQRAGGGPQEEPGASLVMQANITSTRFTFALITTVNSGSHQRCDAAVWKHNTQSESVQRCYLKGNLWLKKIQTSRLMRRMLMASPIGHVTLCIPSILFSIKFKVWCISLNTSKGCRLIDLFSLYRSSNVWSRPYYLYKKGMWKERLR